MANGVFFCSLIDKLLTMVLRRIIIIYTIRIDFICIITYEEESILSTKETIRELSRRSQERVRELVRAKREGTPLIEYNSTFIPEELIRAAGANTYFMCRGGEPEPTDAVLDYMLRFMNPLSRSMAGYMELGLDPITPNADLVAIAETDCHVGRISELMEFKGVKVGKVGVPADWEKPVAFEYYANSIRELLKKVEEITGKSVDMAAAKKNIEVSNRINTLFRRLDALRRGESCPIGFEDYIRLQHLSFSACEPEQFADELEKLCDELEAGKSDSALPANAPRVLVAGRVIAIGDYTMPRLLDSFGCAVTADMLDEGVRVTERDVDTDGDLVENFARNRYLDTTPIDLFQPSWKQRFERMKQLIADGKVDGVIWYQLAFDEIYDMEYSCVAKWLGEMKVPLLKLETAYSYSREEMGPLTNRIENFVQNLKEAK